MRPVSPTCAPAVTRDAFVALDDEGTIRYLSPHWAQRMGQHLPHAELFRVGENYLAMLDTLLDPGSTYMQRLAQGLLLVLHGHRDHVELEIPYADGQQWHWLLIQMEAHMLDHNPGVLVQQRELSDALRRN
jgi:hypothetical protein